MRAWLLSDKPVGAHASAVIYSVVQTARANGLEPCTWLRRVRRDLRATKTAEATEALLSWNLRSTWLVDIMAQGSTVDNGALTINKPLLPPVWGISVRQEGTYDALVYL